MMLRVALAVALVVPAALLVGGCGGGAGNAPGTGGAGGGSGGAAGTPGSGTGGAGSGTGGTGGTAGVDAATPSDAGTGGSGGAGGGTDGGPGGSDASGGGDASGGPTRSFVYVSGYAAPITIFALNTTTGALTPAGTATTGVGGEPTSLAFSPDKRFVYAGDEQKNGAMGRVIAYAINQTTGALQEINREGTLGAVTAHVGVHPSGKWVLTANYDTGTVTVFPVRADGGVGPGKTPVPAGGQSHYIAFDATGTFLFVPCVQSNHIAMFRFADGVLTPNTPPTVSVPGGPRHLAFSPDDRFAYLLTQSSSAVVALAHDKATGRLTVVETVASPTGGSVGAHIAVHPSGKFVYASNRADNSISIFSADATSGRLTRVTAQRDMISYPWWFGLDAAGQLLIVANDRSATVLVHRVDPTAGTLQPLGMPVTVAMRPTYVGILAIPQ